MLADTHCHINSIFFSRPGAVIERARSAGVGLLLNAGIDIPTSREAARISSLHKGVLFSPGIHPRSAEKTKASDIAELRKLAISGAASAVGETGLDFHSGKSSIRMQKELFRETILIAKEANLPLVIHSRSASEDVFQILSDSFKAGGAHPNGIMHCFSGDAEFAAECAGLNFFISFAGNLTYPKSEGLRAAAAACPAGKILLETDSPFLPPQPERGKKGEPSFLVHTARELAKIRKIPFSEAARLTGENAVRVLPGTGKGG